MTVTICRFGRLFSHITRRPASIYYFDPKHRDEACNHTIIRRYKSSLPQTEHEPQTQAYLNKYIISESSFRKTGSWFERLQQIIGVGRANKFALRRATIFHYQACTDKLDFEDYFDKFKLPDTVFSFFLIIQLHVWMCQVRSMLEGPEGRVLRNQIIERMWEDLETRLKRIELYSVKERKSVQNDLLFHHQAAMMSYDEGLLTDDKTLANAIWRTLYSKCPVEPDTLEFVVKYVRIQMSHLRSIGPREWCLDGKFDWVQVPPMKVPIYHVE